MAIINRYMLSVYIVDAGGHSALLFRDCLLLRSRATWLRFTNPCAIVLIAKLMNQVSYTGRRIQRLHLITSMRRERADGKNSGSDELFFFFFFTASFEYRERKKKSLEGG